ncbi:MAG: bifunctional riboflavin kinase/FAD synthetase [Candidatus Solibacter sp.]|nr:bifunctional riboflavin kinase/FAD synthetase [Candidatus Solibacter sp.]
MTRLRIFRSLDEAAAVFDPSALTIGNFDGLHVGHRELMRRTVRLAQESNSKPSALTFHPHPKAIVSPAGAPKLLTLPEERCALMAEEGIRQVLILPFDASIAALQPAEFFRRVLIDTLGARAVCVGDNFHFGRKQAGQVELLAGLGAELGIKVEIVPAITRRGAVVSSSEIRRLIGSGNVSRAGRLLERPYSMSGEVVRGEGRGSRETVPTLNLEVSSLDSAERALPAKGVYITRTLDTASHRRWASITNVGDRPTFGGGHLTIETFLLDELRPPTPSRIRLEFFRRVREEKRFDGAGALKAQIMTDIARARAFFRRVIREQIAEPTLPPLP